MVMRNIVDYHNESKKWIKYLLFRVSAGMAETLIKKIILKAIKMRLEELFFNRCGGIIRAERVDDSDPQELIRLHGVRRKRFISTGIRGGLA